MTSGPKLYISENSDMEIIEDVFTFLKGDLSRAFISSFLNERKSLLEERANFIDLWNLNFKTNKSITIEKPKTQSALNELFLIIDKISFFVRENYKTERNIRIDFDNNFEHVVFEYTVLKEGAEQDKITEQKEELFREYEKSFDNLIKAFKEEYSKKQDGQITINITYNINIGELSFNQKVIQVSGKQKDVMDHLVKQGLEIKTSWDDIYDQFNDYSDKTMPEKKRSVGNVVNEINERTERFLLEDKALINRKENEYWLQYKIGW